jgi:hypothetical protein
VIAARCTSCGAAVSLPSQFDLEGNCPECDGDEGCLVAEDDYEPQPTELQCAECGWKVEAGVEIEFPDDVRVFTVDDDCFMCAQAGFGDRVLAPADTVAVRDQPEYAVARGAAKKVLAEHGARTVPIDVEAIAAARGLAVVRKHFRHDGMLTGMTIEVPIGHAGAERFVIAHEIGHFELRHKSGREKIEPEANAFASELIIPRDELRRRIRARPYLSQLAQDFTVSRQAMFYAVNAARLTSSLTG